MKPTQRHMEIAGNVYTTHLHKASDINIFPPPLTDGIAQALADFQMELAKMVADKIDCEECAIEHGRDMAKGDIDYMSIAKAIKEYQG